MEVYTNINGKHVNGITHIFLVFVDFFFFVVLSIFAVEVIYLYPFALGEFFRFIRFGCLLAALFVYRPQFIIEFFGNE